MRRTGTHQLHRRRCSHLQRRSRGLSRSLVLFAGLARWQRALRAPLQLCLVLLPPAHHLGMTEKTGTYLVLSMAVSMCTGRCTHTAACP